MLVHMLHGWGGAPKRLHSDVGTDTCISWTAGGWVTLAILGNRHNSLHTGTILPHITCINRCQVYVVRGHVV